MKRTFLLAKLPALSGGWPGSSLYKRHLRKANSKISAMKESALAINTKMAPVNGWRHCWRGGWRCSAGGVDSPLTSAKANQRLWRGRRRQRVAGGSETGVGETAEATENWRKFCLSGASAKDESLSGGWLTGRTAWRKSTNGSKRKAEKPKRRFSFQQQPHGINASSKSAENASPAGMLASKAPRTGQPLTSSTGEHLSVGGRATLAEDGGAYCWCQSMRG